jgi:D-glycero-D-manno-heptose 1,7-bisphosphate phosphatase
MTRAVFLDRDGVLNAAILDARGRPLPPRSAAEFSILPGVREGCAALRAAGFRLICITNQPDIARGTADIAFVDRVNAEVAEACGLDALYVCPHDDADDCNCRKPKPGMLLRGRREFGIDLAASFMVGDRFRDVEAGQAAGVRTVFIDYAYPEPRPARPADFSCGALGEAVAWILQVHEAEGKAARDFPS